MHPSRALLAALLVVPLLSRAETAAPPAPAETNPALLQHKVTELEQQVTDDENELSVERGKTNAMSRKALDLENQLAEALKRIKDLEAQLADLQKQLADEQAKNKSAQDRIAELERQLAAERQKNLDLEKRVGELEAKLAEAMKQNGALEAQIAATKGALAELEKRKAEADARVAEFKALIEKFRALIDAGKLRVRVVDGRMVVELATDVLFASGSASLSSEGRKAIIEVTQILASIADRKFQVEGHTDNVPIATEQFPSNWELASARAITVVKTMLQNGMPPPRISAASYADVRPAMSNETKEGKKANRRIEITLVPDLSSLPGFDELNRVAGAN